MPHRWLDCVTVPYVTWLFITFCESNSLIQPFVSSYELFMNMFGLMLDTLRCTRSGLFDGDVWNGKIAIQARKREIEEKKVLLESIKAGKVPSVPAAVSDEEAEEPPDLEIQVPKHKVKLIIGAGGERIKAIQRKTRTRIQVSRQIHSRIAQNHMR
jgi:hypothetical protein